MKKIFSLFAAALMSAVMFAGNLVPGDTILWTKGDATEVFGEGTNANGNKWRDLAYYNGVVYAIAHSQDVDGMPRIYKFAAETGSYLGDMDVSAVYGGDIPLTSLQILDNGEVIAMGCRAKSAEGGVPIYYWDSIQGKSKELMRATIANGGKRVEMIHYEGTLANGKIYLAAEQCDKITVIPVVNKAVVADQISYITLTGGTSYIGYAPRVINVTDTTISICSSTKAMTYKISDGSCLTWTDLTGANQEGGNGVAFFEYNNEKYWATVKMGNVSAATLANACVQVQTYTGFGRWGASGVVQKYCSAADVLPSAERNTSFTTGVAVRVNEDGYSVWACSVNQGIIAYRYVEPVPAYLSIDEVASYKHDKTIVDIAPSNDGKKLYAIHTGSTKCVEIIGTDSMRPIGFLKDIPTALTAIGGGVGVDANGAIYVCNANGASAASDLYVYKWANDTAAAEVFASLGKSNSFTKYGTTVGSSNFRIGTDLDVKIDASGNGFILIPYASNTSVCMLYIPVVNNVAGTVQEVKLNGVAASKIPNGQLSTTCKFMGLQINDDNTLWYDASIYRPILCSYNIDGEGVFSVDSIGIFPEKEEPAINISNTGISSFWYKGRHYAALGTNVANANEMYIDKNRAMLAEINVGEDITAEWIQALPDGGVGAGSPTYGQTRAVYAYNSTEDAVYLFTFVQGANNSIYCHKMQYIGDPVNVSGITLDKNAMELEVGFKGGLKASYEPVNATDVTTTWTTSDPTVATVVNGVVTAVGEGTATITATCGSVSATCEVTVYGHYTPNIYASDLKVISVSEENMAVVSYVLNTDATAVTLNILNADGSIFKSYPLAGLKKGLNSVGVDLGFVESGNHDWSITATAPATTTANVLPQRSIYNFYSPGGMAIDNNFESPYFGNVYVTETRENKTTGAGRVVREGIQILTPAMEGNGVSYNGGVAWIEDAAADGNGFVAAKMGPQRLTVDENGLVYVNDNERGGDWNTTGLWSMDPANPSAAFVPVLDLAGYKTIYNRVNAMLVKGKDANRVLYTCDWSDSIVAYPIGNTATYSQCGTKWAAFDSPLSPQPLRVMANDPINGGMWVFSRSVTDSSNPAYGKAGIAYFNKNGERTLCDVSFINPEGSGAVSPDGTMLAFANGANVVVYTIAFDEAGVPTLTPKDTIGTSSENGPGFAFDVANNLYIASSNSEWIAVYPMAKAENSFTTPAPKAAVLTTYAKTMGTVSDPYTVGGEGADFASLYDACVAVNDAVLNNKVDNPVWLEITADLVEPKNCALIFKPARASQYLYIYTEKEHTVTFTQTKDPNAGPSGAFVMGVHHKNGIAHTDTFPTSNIYIEGGGKLTFTTSSDFNNSGYMIVYYGNVKDSYITGCKLENKRTSGSTYAVTFRTMNKGTGHSEGVQVDNCEIIATASGAAQGIYFNGSSATVETEYPTNCLVTENKITACSRGIFLNGANKPTIQGNEFHVIGGNGFMASGIFGSAKVADSVKVVENQFVEMVTANTYDGEYGLNGILASGGGTWYIENNYFGGFNATGAGNTRMLGVRCGSPCVVRHNTFVMPELTGTPTTPLLTANPITCLYVAGTASTMTIQNNLLASYETKANNSLIRGALDEASSKGNLFFLAPAEGSKAVVMDGAAPAAAFTNLSETLRTNNITAPVTFDSLYVLSEASMTSAIGVPAIAEITKDIKGNTRNTPKVIPGCYEPKNINEGEPTSIDEIEVEGDDVRKVIVDGQLYIIREGAIYNIQGQVVK